MQVPVKPPTASVVGEVNVPVMVCGDPLEMVPVQVTVPLGLPPFERVNVNTA